MKNLIHEIHRRSLWQVLGIYLAGSWVALQVVEQLTEAAGLPDWVRPFSLVLLILGFPIVMATAFVQEGLQTKEPEAPKQSLADVGEVPPPPPPERAGRHRLFTWRNALLGGAAAFALLALLAVGWFVTRSLGVGPAATLVAQGVLEERDRVVLADFRSAGDDPGLGEALTEALRIELGNSDVIGVVDGSDVTQALQRMQRDPADGLSRQAALELAVREGHKAVIAGEVRELAGGYQLSAELLRASDGTSLAGFRETARGADDLIDAIDAISKDIRQKVGESIRSVRGSEPLEQVSTASLEALQRYSDGLRAFDVNDMGRAGALLEEAVSLDTAFAMAWRKLGAVYQNRNENQRVLDAATAAFRHRERLTRRERLHVEGMYHFYVAGDRAAAIRAFEDLVESDPTDFGASNNLAVAMGGSDPERAIELYSAGIEGGSPALINYTNLINPLLDVGRFDEALEALEEAEQRFPEAARVPLARARVRHAMGDYEAAEAALTEVEEGFPGTFEAGRTALVRSVMDVLRGRVAGARRRAEDAVPRAVANGQIGDFATLSLQPAYADLQFFGDTARATAHVRDVLGRYPLEEFAAGDRPTLEFADFFVRAGEADRARTLLERWESDRIGGDPSPWLLELLEARLALAAGDADGAIRELERLAAPGPERCRVCTQWDLAVAYQTAGRRDEAIGAYEAHVNGVDVFRVVFGGYTEPLALERLGSLLEERARNSEPPVVADLALAAEYYARFADLWATADEALQPRVTAARTRLEAIQREIG